MATFDLEKFKRAKAQALKKARLAYDSSKRPKYVNGKPLINNKPIPASTHRGGCGCGRKG